MIISPRRIRTLLLITLVWVGACSKGAKDEPGTGQDSLQGALGGQPLEPFQFLLDWQAEPTYLGIYYAKATGEFAKLGLDVEIIESWGANQAVSAVAAGKYPISTASGGATILGYNSGADIVSLAVLYPRIPTVVYGLASTGIKTPKDLEGRTIGVYPSSITKNEFDAFVKRNGLDARKLKIESLSGADIPLVMAGKVDAVLHYTEMSPVAVELGSPAQGIAGAKTFELRLAEYGVAGYGLNIVTSRARYAREGARLQKVAAAAVAGYQTGCRDRTAAVDTLMRIFPQKDSIYVRQSWDRVCNLLGPNPGRQDAAGWQETIDVYRGLGLLTRNVSPAAVLP